MTKNEIERLKTSKSYTKGDLNWPKTTQKELKQPKTTQNNPKQAKMTQKET